MTGGTAMHANHSPPAGQCGFCQVTTRGMRPNPQLGLGLVIGFAEEIAPPLHGTSKESATRVRATSAGLEDVSSTHGVVQGLDRKPVAWSWRGLVGIPLFNSAAWSRFERSLAHQALVATNPPWTEMHPPAMRPPGQECAAACWGCAAPMTSPLELLAHSLSPRSTRIPCSPCSAAKIAGWRRGD